MGWSWGIGSEVMDDNSDENLTWPSRLTGFKLLGIPFLVGKISRSSFYFKVHWLSEKIMMQ